MPRPLIVATPLVLLLLLSSCASNQDIASPTRPPPTSTSPPLPRTIPLSGAGGSPAVPPSARGYHQMALDAESNRVILFSGEASPQSGFLGGTWAYDLARNSWQEMSPTQTPHPAAAADCLAYDTESDRVILFVGSYFYGLGQDPEQAGAGETWAYDYNNDSWTQLHPATSPFGLVGARMAYDAESDRVILFGGAEVETFNPSNATWAYDTNADTWTEMTPEMEPQREYFHAMAYSPADDRVLLLKAYPNQLWSYDYNADAWEQLESPSMPPARYYSSMVYDEGLDRVFLFGGETSTSEKPLDDLWSFDSSSAEWKELVADNAPSRRGWHAAAYSGSAQVILIFGGGPSREAFTDETWIYDPRWNAWTQITTPS